MSEEREEALSRRKHVHIEITDGQVRWCAADGSSHGHIPQDWVRNGLTLTVWDGGGVSWVEHSDDGHGAVGQFPAPSTPARDDADGGR